MAPRAKRRFRCDFFRVHGASSESFATHLRAIEAMDGDERAREIHGNDVRLQRFSEVEGGLIEADLMLVLYHGDTPVLATREGDEEPIKLGDGQGFGYGTALIFDPSTNLLLLQRSKHSIDAVDVARYIESCHGMALGSCLILPVMRRDKQEEIDRWDRITAIELNVSGVGSSLYHDAKVALGQAFTDPDASGAETIHVLFANNAGLTKSWAKSFWSRIQAALSGSRGVLDFSTTKISGKIQSDRATRVLSLLELQLGGSTQIEIGPERYMVFESRMSAMREIWKNLVAHAGDDRVKAS